MQEDSAVNIGVDPSNIKSMGVYILSNFNSQRMWSAKPYTLRTGRHGGQREQRLTRPSRDPRAQKASNLEAREGPIWYEYMYMYMYGGTAFRTADTCTP